MEGQGLFCELCNVPLSDKRGKEAHILGKKHQLALHNAYVNDTKEKCGVFVTGLPNLVKKEEIFSFFSTYGKIVDHFFGENNRFVIIQFSEPAPAQNLLQTAVSFRGKTLYVKPRTVRERLGTKFEQAKPVEDFETINESLKTLPNFEAQLHTLVRTLQPNFAEVVEQYKRLCFDLQLTLQEIFPGCIVHPFGSTITGLYFQNSDVDLYIQVLKTAMNDGETEQSRASAYVKKARNLLHKYGRLFWNVCGIPKAKTPIVKCVHVPTQISCDFNFKNMLGVCNSHLIKYYLSLDHKLTSAMVVIKYWGKVHELTGSSGKFSNYSLVMLLIFYLQHPPFSLLSVHSLQSPEFVNMQEGWNGGFYCSNNINLDAIKSTSIPELLQGFFKFYSNFDYGLNIICPFLGQVVPKIDFLKPELLSDSLDLYKRNIARMLPLKVESSICVQDPFEQNHNLTSSIPPKVLEEFMELCKLGVDSFSGEIDNTALYKLFTEEPNCIGTSRFLIADLECRFKIAMGSCLAYLESKIATDAVDKQNEIKKIWYDCVNSFVVSVLIEVFKFTVTVKQGSSVVKNQRLSGQTDVHDNNIIDSVVFHCVGKYNLWEARKSIAKDVDLSSFHTILEKQMYITNYICDVLYEGIIMTNPIIECDIILQAKSNPIEMEFKIMKINSQKGCFKTMAIFFAHKLPSWFEVHMKDLATENKTNDDDKASTKLNSDAKAEEN